MHASNVSFLDGLILLIIGLPMFGFGKDNLDKRWREASDIHQEIFYALSGDMNHTFSRGKLLLCRDHFLVSIEIESYLQQVVSL